MGPLALHASLLPRARGWIRSHWEICAVAAASCLSVAILFAYGHVVWFGDSHTFFNFAYFLVRGVIDPNLFWRPPGYPMIIVASGALWTGSLAGLLALQALSALLIPLLAYWTIAPVSRKAALVTGLAVVASGLHVIFATTIYHDQPFMFGAVLITFLVVRLAIGPPARWPLYLLAAALLAAGWLRPTVLTALPLIALIVALGSRKLIKHALLAFALFIAASSAFGIWRDHRADTGSTLGRQLFFNVYLSSDGMPLDGPAGQELRARMIALFESDEGKAFPLRQAGPSFPEEVYEELYTPYEGDPEALIDALFAHPHTVYFWLVWTATSTPSQDYGKAWDPLLRRASLEHILAHPWRFVGAVLSHYKGYTFGPAWRYYHDTAVPERANFAPFALGLNDARPQNVIPEIAAHWYESSPTKAWEQRFNAIYKSVYELIAPASYFLMLIGAVGFLRAPGSARTASLIVFFLHSSNVATMAVLVDPQVRYQIEFVPIAMIGAGFGLLRLALWGRTAMAWRWDAKQLSD